MSDTYQGFANYETFLVCLDLQNDRHHLQAVRRLYAVDQFKDYVESVVRTYTTNALQTDLLEAALSRIDFKDLFNHLVVDYYRETLCYSLTPKEAEDLVQTRWWLTMPTKEVVLLQIKQPRLCLPSTVFCHLLQQVLGRPVDPTQLLNTPTLVAEIEATNND